MTALTKRDADWLRSYAASMWEAMKDNIDAEEFEGDRDNLVDIAKKIEAIVVTGPMARKALQRPDNYETLTPTEKWDIDKELGILDWDGKDTT